MPFSRRQIDLLEKDFHVEAKIFYLENRSSFSYLLKAAKDFKKVLNDFNPDICHPHYGSVNSLFVALFSTKPIIITFHGSDLNKTPSDGIISDFIARLFSNLSALRAKSIIVVSEQLKKQLWWKQKNANVIPIGTNIKEFYPIDKEIAIKELNEQRPFPSIVFNANNPIIKRLDLAEEAIELVKKDYPHANLYKLGGDVDPKKIKYILNATDMLLLCSDREGSPTIIKEAMACNQRIVSTDVGDVKIRIELVNEALIVKQTPASIAKGIISLIEKKDLIFNGREELLRQELDEHTLESKIYSIYKNII